MIIDSVVALLVTVNAATGRHILAAAVLACWVIFRTISYCCGLPGTKNGVTVMRVTRRQQHALSNGVRTNALPSSQIGDVKDRHVMIGGKIEAVFRCPTGEKANPKTCCLLTHPWAILGGDLNNNVPVELSYALSQYGFATCRFNFRGVGRSKGCCTWRGHGERDDLKAVVDWLCDEQGITRVVLVGYSYGSMISNSCADLRPEIMAFVSISTPFPCYWGLSLFNCAQMLNLAHSTDKPKLFLCGNQDQFISTGQYRRYVRSFPVPIESQNSNDGLSSGQQSPMVVYLLEDVDHFWNGQEMAACGLILKFFKNRPELVGKV